MLDNDLFLNKSVDLLLEEVAFVDVILLHLLKVFLEVGDVFDDLLQDVVGGLRRVVLQSGALRPQELHFLLVVIKQLHCLLRVPLLPKHSG